MANQSASEATQTAANSNLTSAGAAMRRGKVADKVAETLAMLSGLYGLGTTLFLALGLAPGEELPIVGLFNTLLPALLFPAVALAIGWLAARRWKLAALMAPAILALVSGYAALFLPRPLPPASAPQLSVLTFNLHAERVALAPMVEVIRAAGADIVALQELSPEAARMFSAELGDVYPYRALHLHPSNPVMGQGVLSKYPLRDSVYWQVEMWHQRVTVTMRERDIALYNVHPNIPFVLTASGLAFDAGKRGRDIADILERAGRERTAVILAGDFNMTDRCAHYRRVTANYRDAFHDAGWGFGFTFPDFSSPNALPRGLPRVALPLPLLTRIDYVFYSEHFQAAEALVWPSAGGSDHRPVLARLAIVRQ